jgi:hypothetical protein
VQLTQIESVFRSLKSEVGIRPIYHPLERRADAHILIAFLAHCLQITLKQGLLLHAPGLTPVASAGEVSRNPNDRSVDSCRRSTVVDSAALQATFANTKLVIEKLRLELPNQPPPRLTAQTKITKSRSRPSGRWALCGEDRSMAGADSKALSRLWPLPPAKDRLGPVSSNWKPNPASLRPKSLGCIDR